MFGEEESTKDAGTNETQGNNDTQKVDGANNENRCKIKELYKLLIIAATIIIVCPIVVVVIFMICNKKLDNDTMQSGLLATGLSIISIAITAWTGLNIINFLDRKKLNEIEEKSKKLEETAKELEKKETEIKVQFNDLKKETESQLIKWQKDSDSIKNSVEVSFKNYNVFFLQELLKTSNDILSLYFYNEFRDFFNKQKKYSANSLLLMEIEKDFFEVYYFHNYSVDKKESLISKANEGLKKIKEYLEKQQPEGLIKQYLNYRIADFDYYKGYCETSPKDVYECFMEAIDICFDFAAQVGIPLVYNEQEYEKFPDYNGGSPEIACYLANAVGDAYSNIVHVCKAVNGFETEKRYITKQCIIVWAKKAVHFCGCAVKWSKHTSYEREVYFRNLGCAYERLDNINEKFFKHKKKIIHNYRQAFIKMHNDSDLMELRKQKIYHTILSYYEKYFKKEFSELSGGCLKYTKEKRKSVLNNKDELPDYRAEMAKMISGIKEKGNDAIDVNMLHDYVMIARSGVDHNPHYTLRISLLGLSYTYVVFLIKAGNDLAKQKFSNPLEYYIAEIEKLISYLNILGMKDDDYVNELCLRYKGIKGI